MLNYIKAELWKVSRHRSLYALTALLVLCAAVYCGVIGMISGSFGKLAGAVSVTMITGMLAAPLVAQLIDGGVAETLKNEVSFGLGRAQVYWGKLFSGLLLGLGVGLAVLAGCLAGGWLMLPAEDPEAAREGMRLVGFCLLGAVPLWCGMLAACHMLATLIRSTAVWISGYFVSVFLGQPILVVLSLIFFRGDTTSWQVTLLQAAVMPYSLLMPGYLVDWHTGEYLLWCWGIGLGWLAVSTAVGLLCFRRRDVK